ncbi:hypothetical protein TanjilG_08067 [Lupinus angustifolius]|uniref:Cytochrome b5 heme-binding domain-containing protein n=1 Tax=Lupinus angustifolius TaxID=3871 RepID=A0A1J7H9L9_LUPAN|nr:PREDICTED: cytochrome B5-like protein [Lupinus angustifolius]XP_019436086.1 PREDICTED: cytochrome B5-like protein [Lupinus angustifolius]XP_019457432.1 PREDICTED: cytochrome B5-like protein [Lupinus angustifolius]XP_019457471.1 PREDICTED: cytochrome B5-like protein [Lupinus angustifolius]XP_019460130.1 PREDICTED: cytochrome B5-like protein [Lupinus angustifolius]XP_019460351.1 PREDICTED: cytochrome B5-like protein [Lupinus angustifolius]OIW01226.1 hypothetical protein TanjilG_10387 [Lupinu
MVFIVALALLFGLLLALLLIPRHHKSGQKGNAHSTLNNKDKESKSFSKSEVSLHHKRTDCWIIIKNKVYDVTPYVEEHPGGDAILAHAGDDSTEGFFGYASVPFYPLFVCDEDTPSGFMFVFSL